MNERQEKMNRRWYAQWLSCGFTGKMEDRMDEYGWFRDRLEPETITKVTVINAKEADIEIEYAQLPNGKWVAGRWLTTKIDNYFGSVSGASIWDAQYDTKGEAVTAELDSIRPYLFGGLILLIVFGILSIFLNLGVFNTLICYAGIALFLGYTAYDVSKVRENYYFYAGQGELLKKASIFSALQLYLDFINLFLYILRILGNRKD